MVSPVKISDGSHIRPWTKPLIIHPVMVYCPCSVVWAPDISSNPQIPFVVKHYNPNCNIHRGWVSHE